MSIDGSLYDDVPDFHKSRAEGLFLELDKVKREKTNLMLTTPDTRTFPLSTPEVENLLTTCGGATTTSNTPTPSRFFRPSAPVTAEQEMYAQGFLDALGQLEQVEPGKASGVQTNLSSVIHHAPTAAPTSHAHELMSTHAHQFGSITGPNPSLASVAPTYVTATMDFIPNIPPSSQSEPGSSFPMTTSTAHSHNTFANSYHPMLNVYPSTGDAYGSFNVLSGQTVAQSYPSPMNPELLRELQAVVPADLKTQEHMKVERKKARNRIAASKCRIRRLQRESDLQTKVKMLREHNQELNNEVNGLREQISSLKKALLHHMKTGCQVNLPEGFELGASSSDQE